MGVCDNVLSHTKSLTVPKPSSDAMRIILGIVNFFFFGVGTMIAGCLVDDVSHMIIGLCQLLIPFVGWLWSIVWGGEYLISVSLFLVAPRVSVCLIFRVCPSVCSTHDYRQVESVSMYAHQRIRVSYRQGYIYMCFHLPNK